MSFTYRVADYIADFIEKIGVKDVFLLPGGGAMHLVDAVGQNSNINVVACLHEQAAAISAEAYSRINENIGVQIYNATDAGGSMFVHSFGAYYGLAATYFFQPKRAATSNNLKSSY